MHKTAIVGQTAWKLYTPTGVMRDHDDDNNEKLQLSCHNNVNDDDDDKKIAVKLS